MANNSTSKLKTLQDKVHDIMIEMTEFKGDKHSDIITMNLVTVSKELNLMINNSITNNNEIKN